jgi:hypothetical protein
MIIVLYYGTPPRYPYEIAHIVSGDCNLQTQREKYSDGTKIYVPDLEEWDITC